MAIALNYSQVHPDLNPRLILTATLLSILLFEFVASREAAALLEGLEAGETAGACRRLEAPVSTAMIRRLVVLALAGGRRRAAGAAPGPYRGRHRAAVALSVRHPAPHGRYLRRPRARLGFPRLVGYLWPALALGPSVTGIVPAGVLEDLAMMKRLAVGLIGLLAGAELRMSDLRLRHRAILWILALQGAAVLLAVWGAALWPRATGFRFC